MPLVKYKCGCIAIPLIGSLPGTCLLISNCEGVEDPMSITINLQEQSHQLNAKEAEEATEEIRQLIRDGKHLRKLKSWMQED
jgi:DNA-binding protein H-NS